MNGTDQFICGFTNIHTTAFAGVAFVIFDYVSQEIVLDGTFVLAPGEMALRSVSGPGLFVCDVNIQGGKVQSFVSLGVDGRFAEVQPIQTK